jgi:hypothetical protein
LKPFHLSTILKAMSEEPSALANWTSEQIAAGRRWVETWRLAGVELERIRRQELRELDTYRTISLLCGPADYTIPPRAPKPFSGLVEQQWWFMKAAGRDYIREQLSPLAELKEEPEILDRLDRLRLDAEG